MQPTALPTTLRIDAAASGATGLLLLAVTPNVAALLGLPADLLRAVGGLLVPVALFLLWLAPRATRRRGAVRAVVVGNWAWVVASIALVVSGVGPRTGIGDVLVLLQAAVVAGFAYIEQRDLRRTGPTAGLTSFSSAAS